MATLYEIGADLEAIEELLEERAGDISDPEVEAAILAWMEESEGDLHEKLDRYARLIRELEARAKMRKEEAARLEGRAKVDERSVKGLKERLEFFFRARGIDKVETEHFRLTRRQNGGKAPLLIDVPEEDIPEAYKLVKTVHTVDKDLIRAMLEKGEEVPFARLGERSFGILIS